MLKLNPKRFALNGAILVCASLLSLAVRALGGAAGADLFLYDTALRNRIEKNPIPLNSSILRLDLNDSSEAALGKAIDSRRAFADVLSVSGKAGAAMALDFIFRHPAEADGDFAVAARGFDIFVQAAAPVTEGSFSFEMESENREFLKKQLWHIRESGGPGDFPVASSFIMSTPAITASASGLGHIGVEADKDGVFRRTPLFYRWEDGLVPVIVGNLGTRTRIEYTVIGAPVNLAQRMESSAPLGGILVASPCREKVPETNSFRFGEKQQIKVKGYDEPVDAYELEFRDSP